MSNLLITERIAGHYQGTESGPLVIVLAGQHGNEQAGVRAQDIVFALLEHEPIINPDFVFKGEVLALRGNLEALKVGHRFIDADQNRLWLQERINWPANDPRLLSEDYQIRELLSIMQTAIAKSQPTEVVILDLHTTTADGGIFVVPAEDRESQLLAAELLVPVIDGMLEDLEGTGLSYFLSEDFGWGRPVRAISFEGGAHYDPLSVDRCVAAILNMLRAVGCVQSADVRTLHDDLLREYGRLLPRRTRLAYVHPIEPVDQFVMMDGFQNFSPVQAGQPVASDRFGHVLSPLDGYLLMPLYQKEGSEGFFIVIDEEMEMAF